MPFIAIPSKVDFTDLVTGSGSPVERNSQVIVHVRGILNRGEVFMDTLKEQGPLHIELRNRDCIAGLRYGIVGMQAGGLRELVVSPHLGYGVDGLPGKVPPNAVLKFEIELLELRPSGVTMPEDYPRGKQLYFFWPGEAKRNWPRVQFGLEEIGCGTTLTIPQQGFTWRHAKTRSVEHHLDQADSRALFAEVAELPQKHPEACLSNDQLWADSLGKANSVTRDSLTNTPCITLGISERGIWQCNYSMRETDPVLLQSNLYCSVKKLVAKVLPPDD